MGTIWVNRRKDIQNNLWGKTGGTAISRNGMTRNKNSRFALKKEEKKIIIQMKQTNTRKIDTKRDSNSDSRDKPSTDQRRAVTTVN